MDKAFELSTKLLPGFGQNQGFKMTFSNGYTISVIFGESSKSDQGETTAEVAVWHSVKGHWLAFKEGAWVKLPLLCTEVLGHQTPDQVADLIQSLKNF